MKSAILLLAIVAPLLAADERQLALALDTKRAFERVEAALAPSLPDASACIQAQASYLPVAPPPERPVVLFHKGYCTLAQAALAQDSALFTDAADSLAQAIAAWPEQVAVAVKQKLPPPPVPPDWRVLAAVAHLAPHPELSADYETQLTAAVAAPACSPAARQLGNLWLGWFALQRADAPAALQRFEGNPAAGWPQFVQGREAFRAGDYTQAAARYQEAVTAWRSAQHNQELPMFERLNPPPDMPAALTALGDAQLLSGNAAAAVSTLDSAVKDAAVKDAAVKASPSQARAYYLRARAKAALGQTDAALEDYNLASRAAFAAAAGKPAGEAHFYQGILLYQRKEWQRAEAEFTDSLNFEIPAAMQSDAVAWRHLAAVSGGACGASRDYLERSLAAASPDFPRDAARSALAACPSTNR